MKRQWERIVQVHAVIHTQRYWPLQIGRNPGSGHSNTDPKMFFLATLKLFWHGWLELLPRTVQSKSKP